MFSPEGPVTCYVDWISLSHSYLCSRYRITDTCHQALPSVLCLLFNSVFFASAFFCTVDILGVLDVLCSTPVSLTGPNGL